MGKDATVMVGGHGQNSYMHNSIHQRDMYNSVVNKVEEVIHERLHIPTKGSTIRVADLGCSVGPNTLHAMQTVLDAIGAKIKSSSSSHDNYQNYEFQICFNDQIENDFNTLFEFLPSNRQYFVAAVPGSFHSRLFPQNSIHYFNSSISLHWLSRAPVGLVNKGRVHCHGGGAEAVAAYQAQFKADMTAFLEARAVELVPGGLLVLLFASRNEWMDADAPRHDMWFPHIEAILRELVAERTLYDAVWNMVEEAIHDRLHIPTKRSTIRVADLGCSVGPNTLHTMQIVLDAIGAKIKSSSNSHDDYQNYEFQICFNDQIGNDFNTLFQFLPPNRQYFAAAVPGSFYSRLFPENSIHYFNCSFALHWLSRPPSGLSNKGRVHCHGGGAEAVAAYQAQFRSDIAAFLGAREVELVPGGLLVLLFICRPEWMEADAPRPGMWLTYIESILREFVAEGKVKEADLDSFQAPIYYPTIGEFKQVVEMKGSFSILAEKIVDQGWCGKEGQGVENDRSVDLHEKAIDMSLAARAVYKETVGNHFGGDIAEDLFERFPETAYQFFVNQPTVLNAPPTAFFILQKHG